MKIYLSLMVTKTMQIICELKFEEGTVFSLSCDFGSIRFHTNLVSMKSAGNPWRLDAHNMASWLVCAERWRCVSSTTHYALRYRFGPYWWSETVLSFVIIIVHLITGAHEGVAITCATSALPDQLLPHFNTNTYPTTPGSVRSNGDIPDCSRAFKHFHTVVKFLWPLDAERRSKTYRLW